MSNTTNRIDWTGIARLPWDLFAGSVDWMCRAAMPPGYFERFYNNRQNLDRGPGMETYYASSRYRENGGQNREGNGQSFSSSDRDQESEGAGNGGALNTGSGQQSGGNDLKGDDVKLVSYKILFTKRGKERILDSGHELVNYNTTHSTYSGVKIAEYLGGSQHNIPDEDRKYIKVHVEVLKRYPKEREDYDRRRVDLLEREVDILDSLEKQVAMGNQKRAA